DQQFERYDLQRSLVRRFQHDGAGGPGFLNLQPSRCADAPAVTGLEAGKSVLRHRGGEVVAESLRGVEKCLVNDAADGMDAQVVGACLTASGAIEPRH